MSLQQLKALVRPPRKPSEVGTLEDWRGAEQKLGIGLPPDYRHFVFTYGTGLFAQFYVVFNPFSSGKYTSLSSSVERICGSRRKTKLNCPEIIPWGLFPDSPGLLPWGTDDNGNYYYWFTKGAPQEWPVLSDNVRGEGIREHGCSMTEYLTNVLMGRIQPLASAYPKPENLVFEQV